MLEYLVSYVIERTGTIRGKKAFQKIFYFLTEQGVPTGLNYSLYHYGPYSSDLDHQTELMEEIDAIKIQKSGIRFDITSSSLTNTYANDKSIIVYKKIIDDTLERLPINNPLLLELLSITHYAAIVQREIYDLNDMNLTIKEVKSIKMDKFTEKQITDAYKYLMKASLL